MNRSVWKLVGFTFLACICVAVLTGGASALRKPRQNSLVMKTYPSKLRAELRYAFEEIIGREGRPGYRRTSHDVRLEVELALARKEPSSGGHVLTTATYSVVDGKATGVQPGTSVSTIRPCRPGKPKRQVRHRFTRYSEVEGEVLFVGPFEGADVIARLRVVAKGGGTKTSCTGQSEVEVPAVESQLTVGGKGKLQLLPATAPRVVFNEEQAGGVPDWSSMHSLRGLLRLQPGTPLPRICHVRLPDRIVCR